MSDYILGKKVLKVINSMCYVLEKKVNKQQKKKWMTHEVKKQLIGSTQSSSVHRSWFLDMDMLSV